MIMKFSFLILKTMSKTIVFDLDDTLVKEIAYLQSAFKAIAFFVDSKDEQLYDRMLSWYGSQENVFERLHVLYPEVTVDVLKGLYRNHVPTLELPIEVHQLLMRLISRNYKLGLITDGYSVTQRHKIEALGIADYFDLIIISEEFGSEKPSISNFDVFHQFQTDSYYYIGDNPKKDFYAPNVLGWKSICLYDDGLNIHKQNFSVAPAYLPSTYITSMLELETVLDCV